MTDRESHPEGCMCEDCKEERNEEQSPTEDPRAKKLNSMTGSPKITTGVDHDLSTSMRPGEDPERIADEIDGLEHRNTEKLKIGRLAEFDLVDTDGDDE